MLCHDCGSTIEEGTANRRLAQKFLDVRLSEVHRGVFLKPVNITLPALGERYIDYAKLHKRSWKRDGQLLASLRAFFGAAWLRDISPLTIEEFQRERVKAVSPATVNREVALLKHMFNMAERWGQHQGTNPVRLVKFLPENNLRFRTLGEDEERKLLACCAPHVRQMVVFALNTGLRSGDIYRLTWKEVDLDHRMLNLIVRKTAKPLEVPLNDDALGVLEARHTERRGAYVFGNPDTGKPFLNLKTGLKAALRRARLSGITWHTLRHTFASRLTTNGIDLVTVKDLLGHAEIKTTLRYAHSNAQAKARAVAQLNGNSDKTVTVATRHSQRRVVGARKSRKSGRIALRACSSDG
ncbi:MAG TPA: site-specific integrase [Terriglobia bacterium]|nr:site-specific integrase [Terriglobia bacterium]